MTNRTRTGLLVFLFAILVVTVIAAGMLVIRFTQGTAVEGDGLLAILLAAFAVTDLLLIRILS